MITVIVGLIGLAVGGVVGMYLERKYAAELTGAISDMRNDIAAVKAKVAKL